MPSHPDRVRRNYCDHVEDFDVQRTAYVCRSCGRWRSAEVERNARLYLESAGRAYARAWAAYDTAVLGATVTLGNTPLPKRFTVNA